MISAVWRARAAGLYMMAADPGPGKVATHSTGDARGSFFGNDLRISAVPDEEECHGLSLLEKEPDKTKAVYYNGCSLHWEAARPFIYNL